MFTRWNGIIFKRVCRQRDTSYLRWEFWKPAYGFLLRYSTTKLLFDEYIVLFFEDSNSERNEWGKRCCWMTVLGVETSGLRPSLSIRCAITNFVRKTSFVLRTNGFFELCRVRKQHFVFFFLRFHRTFVHGLPSPPTTHAHSCRPEGFPFDIVVRVEFGRNTCVWPERRGVWTHSFGWRVVQTKGQMKTLTIAFAAYRSNRFSKRSVVRTNTVCATLNRKVGFSPAIRVVRRKPVDWLKPFESRRCQGAAYDLGANEHFDSFFVFHVFGCCRQGSRLRVTVTLLWGS